MSHPVDRRRFLATSTLATTTAITATAATLAPQPANAALKSANEQVVIGIMGMSRGRDLARTFQKADNVSVKYVCDVDQNRAQAAAASIEKETGKRPAAIGDFHKILDDADVDALVCAAPNHWHAPAGILACAAGKHAYIEKPCSHNPHEGELLVAAARKHKRCVQMGSQRRSGATIREGIALVHGGKIGNVFYSRSWYANLRGPIGTGKALSVPAHLDYELWQGPAPRQPFVSNRLHYNWHWVWHYGNGELGNNGVHSLDVSRWGLGVDYPVRVTSSGGRYVYDDDQQTPDTHVVSFEFPGGKQAVWEGISCNRHGIDGDSFGVNFLGDNGSLHITSGGYKLFSKSNKLVEEKKGARADQEHINNFVAAIRANDHGLLNAEIETGHKSTLLCHLGNIAHRTGRSLNCDPANGHILNDADAMKYWKRDYAPGWEPTV